MSLGNQANSVVICPAIQKGIPRETSIRHGFSPCLSRCLRKGRIRCIALKAMTRQLQPESSAIRRGERLAHFRGERQRSRRGGLSRNNQSPVAGDTFPSDSMKRSQFAQTRALGLRRSSAIWDDNASSATPIQGVLPNLPPTRHAIPSGALHRDMQPPQSQARKRGTCSAAAWEQETIFKFALLELDDSLFLTLQSTRQVSGHDLSVQHEMSAASLALRSRAENDAKNSFLAPQASAQQSGAR